MAYGSHLYRSMSMLAAHPTLILSQPGKALSVEIRLRGTSMENTATPTALAQVLDIATISRRYPDRPPSTRERIYLTATVKGPRP